MARTQEGRTTELNEAKRDLGRIQLSNVALEDRVNRTAVKSPVDGTINQVLVNTVGAVIQPGMDLVEIVPANDTLLVEARIRPIDIAFIHPGQKATVKITAASASILKLMPIALLFCSQYPSQRHAPYFSKIPPSPHTQ